MRLYYQSPIGAIRVEGEDGYVTGVYFSDETTDIDKPENEVGDADATACSSCVLQLEQYFNGERRVFDLPLLNRGTEFRQKVWEALCKIPYGQTISYKELAARIGNPKAIRAVGGANHHNNLSIVVPCHRVIGVNGDLTGYGGELWRKKWLLEHEKRIVDR